MKVNNKKVRFNYEVLENYTTGIKLLGSEIKSIREGDVSINESYCYINNGEIFIKGMYIKEYKFSSYLNHEENRERKLLLNKNEILKINKKIEQKGMTIVATSLYINDRGLCKLNIAVCKGKRDYQKKNTIKERDLDRDLKRNFKY